VCDPTPKQISFPISRSRCARYVLPGALLWGAFFFARAQTTSPQTEPTQPLEHPVHKHKPQRAASEVRSPAPAPVTPDWPINDHPAPASVTWSSPELRVEAANSSLQQILNDVATATGAELEGLTTDERVFGNFGPGSARDVISQLLQGTGYNMVMVGDQGQGVPRQIILSARNTSKVQPPSHPAPEEPEDDSPDYPQYEPQPQPQQPPQVPQAVRPGFPPDGAVPGRIPQQYPQPQQVPQQQPTQPGQSTTPPQN
jgi:hypothetical protein